MSITAQQRELLSQLQLRHENFISEWDEKRGILSFARSENLAFNLAGAAAAETQHEAILAIFLQSYESLFGHTNLMKSLRQLRKKNDRIGFTHYEYQQTWMPKAAAGKRRLPIEIYGSKIAAHFAPDNRL